MTQLEIRLIAYGLLLAFIVGGSGFAGYRFTADHYQAVMKADQAAAQQAVLVQQEKVIALQQAQQAASLAAEKQYEDLKASSTTLGNELSSSLREYAALRRVLVPSAPKAAPGTDAAPAGAGGDSSLTELAGQAATACEADAAALTALQTWASALSR